ncbi:hypothetical protein [Gallaecimonas mangrovi]|uniref:hypothetical protein n=1 Tax=Gallaecimonas mangrovi TaxID=2291597 RepID=UPI000E208554|nr:hypothetical protein [Gallaecimonas mangrovi]
MLRPEILKRVKEEIDPSLSITKRTTPVPYFGDYDNARACTISLNPSDREFCDKNGEILIPEKTRLCSRQELEREDSQELTDSEAIKVIDNCKNYFRKNPYKLWFNKYEEFLKQFELSYYDGSAVHLDIVQWATTPFWNKLSSDTKSILLKKDLPFLKLLLEKNFDFIFLNGLTAVTETANVLDISLNAIPSELIDGKVSQVFLGWYNNSRVIGWSPYIQSASVGGYNKIRKIAEKIISENRKDLIK